MITEKIEEGKFTITMVDATMSELEIHMAEMMQQYPEVAKVVDATISGELVFKATAVREEGI